MIEKTITPTELRANVYKVTLDEVLDTGVPPEIRKGGKTLRIVSAEEPDRLQNLIYRPDVIQAIRRSW
ncbi:MAG: type II toxin-antitoxin system Phd/YefM family antitoxin [Caldilineaceae bacterium]